MSNAARVLKIMPRLPVKRILKLARVAVRALAKDELHVAKFYLDRHVLKPAGYFAFKDETTKEVALSVDQVAREVVGSSHDVYSGATAAEVASGFAVCIESLAHFGGIEYLEIGSAKGKSMGFMGACATRKNLMFRGVSVDPYFDDGYVEGADQPDRFIGNRATYRAPIDSDCRAQACALWKALSLDVTQMRTTSDRGLRDLRSSGRRFNLIYIDGLHDGLSPITDFIGCFELIDDGGIIILDDRHWANVHYLRKICDNTQGLEKVFENWKISAYRVDRGSTDEHAAAAGAEAGDGSDRTGARNRDS